MIFISLNTYLSQTNNCSKVTKLFSSDEFMLDTHGMAKVLQPLQNKNGLR